MNFRFLFEMHQNLQKTDNFTHTKVTIKTNWIENRSNKVELHKSVSSKTSIHVVIWTFGTYW